MTEQEAQEQEWRLEPEYTGSLDPKYHRFKIVTNERFYGDQGDIVTLRALPKTVADRIFEGHKAQQEIRELREELARVRATAGTCQTLLREIQPDIEAALVERDRFRAQLQAAEADKVRLKEQLHRISIPKLKLLAEKHQVDADLTTTTTLLQQAREALEHWRDTGGLYDSKEAGVEAGERLYALLAAIDAQIGGTSTVPPT